VKKSHIVIGLTGVTLLLLVVCILARRNKEAAVVGLSGSGLTYVQSYYRKDGTYVGGHLRNS
jgi:hypothetical protein